MEWGWFRFFFMRDTKVQCVSLRFPHTHCMPNSRLFLHTATSLGRFHSWLESDTRGEIQRNTLYYTATEFYTFLLFFPADFLSIQSATGTVWGRMSDWLTVCFFGFTRSHYPEILSGKPPASLTSTEFRIEYKTGGEVKETHCTPLQSFIFFLLFSFQRALCRIPRVEWVTDWQCARCSTVCFFGFTRSHYPEILSGKPPGSLTSTEFRIEHKTGGSHRNTLYACRSSSL